MLDQADLNGVECIKGVGTIKAVDGSLNLSGITTIEAGIIVEAAEVTTPTPEPANNAPSGGVSIGNSAKVGDVLTANITNLVDLDGLGSFTYQWKAGNTDVGNGTTYTAVTADLGKNITVEVTYTDGAGNTETVTSNMAFASAGPKLNLKTTTLTATTGSEIGNTGGAITDKLGSAVNAAGDVNADGYDDFMVSAPFANGSAGRSYLVLGCANGANFDLAGGNSLVITGENAGDKSGIHVSQAGDLNGDGYADILVGANEHNGFAGRVYVVYGGTSMNTANTGNTGNLTLANLSGVNKGFQISGVSAGDQVGFMSNGIGDVNGDGYDD